MGTGVTLAVRPPRNWTLEVAGCELESKTPNLKPSSENPGEFETEGSRRNRKSALKERDAKGNFPSDEECGTEGKCGPSSLRSSG
jgi:hypothetical protein